MARRLTIQKLYIHPSTIGSLPPPSSLALLLRFLSLTFSCLSNLFALVEYVSHRSFLNSITSSQGNSRFYENRNEIQYLQSLIKGLPLGVKPIPSKDASSSSVITRAVDMFSKRLEKEGNDKVYLSSYLLRLGRNVSH